MIKCLPQEYLLRQGGTLQGLYESYAIESKWHPKHKSLVQLKYNQILSPMNEPIVQQCRGLILDAQSQWRPTAWPFNKFFNHGEPHAVNLVWPSCSIQEKLDGSLCILYFYDREWHVATSGMPDAGGDVNGFGFTFAQLFWSVFKEKGYVVPPPVDRGLTFMFELATPYNRVVVQHKKNSLTLIGVKNNASGYEMHPDQFDQYFDTVTEFGLWSLEGILKSFDNMNPLQQEGYVVVDKNFNRLKVKHPGYVAIHHLRSAFGPRKIVEIIQKGESDELLAHFPEWKPAFDKVQSAFDRLHVDLHMEYMRLRDIGDQKEFALEAVKTRYPAALFMVRAGKAQSVRDALAQMTTDKLYELLEVKDVELVSSTETLP